MSLPAITIIGMGNVGSALYKACDRAGYPIKSLFNRSGLEVDSVFTGLPGHAEELGEMVFITVSDNAIKEVSSKLSLISGSIENKCFIHCSGTLSSRILSELIDKGGHTGSFHPMMAVNTNTNSFQGIYFDGEGDDHCLKKLSKLAETLGAHFFKLDGDKRKFLHAASVVASNYLVTLAEIASLTGSRAGQPKEEILKALIPLMKSTIRNLERGDTKKALTGPIARGEKEVILKHLNALPDTTAEGRVYRIMGLYTLGLISEDKAEELKGLFSDSV